ncbi:hypothetical protein [Natrialba asiatica]|uniref:Uncharacterized protein n=1 Tax=Natrialba asiatica (strain ATCC 700177 / DSM 12278 / JCM 9576 / FERM P-10747 / NBRC 102637 / 172P1) TaxID=29540 RepID=M0AZT4_NATA1|nr:hypothetical protein [Natrialba asiatica]ELZ04020.1 hypothetical protein C481_04601 [Natrialba asiatica DSM 12278]
MDESPFCPESVDDPRITGQFCRRVSGPAGDCYLLGVVHDHPASINRVMRVADAVDPAVLALELPPAALPLYRVYARDGDSSASATRTAPATDTDPARSTDTAQTTHPTHTPPAHGGEMSAAISATDAELVGIDAPNWSFLRRLATRLVADRVSAGTARRLLSSLGGATRDALRCRVAATLTHATSMTITRGDQIEYDCDFDDPPETQAAHERAHVASVQALLGSVQTDDSALAYRDETRERCMIDRLTEIRAENDGAVLAIVGIDHLERLATALSANEAATTETSNRTDSSPLSP